MKYYSEQLNTLFDTKEECAAAEEKHARAVAEAEAKKKALAEERAGRAKVVDELYKAMVEAKKNYNDALQDFIRDYGSYHFTYRSSDPFFSSIFNLF